MKPVWLPLTICLTFLFLVPASSVRLTDVPIGNDLTAMAVAADEPPTCGINLHARYDTRLWQNVGGELRPTPSVRLVMGESKVRIKSGTWASLAPRCNGGGGGDYDLPIYWSTDFGHTCELDFGCNVRRRYRFLVCAPKGWGGSGNCYASSTAKAWTYYPSAGGWTEQGEINIDLGDLGLLFPHLHQDAGAATPKTPQKKETPDAKKK